MTSSRSIWIFLSLWLAAIAAYAAVSLSLRPESPALSTFANLVQCVTPLVANAGLLLNAGTPIMPLYFYVGIQIYDGTRFGGIEPNLVDEHPFREMYRREEKVTGYRGNSVSE